MSYWAKAPMPREQLVMFATTLDDRIPGDDPMRLLAEVLDGYDWSAWESRYHGKLGQPPIHPKILAGLWLYGMRRGIRSSRKLEYMAGRNVDFMWLAQGHEPDHSTLSNFRLNFADELKSLFKHVMHIALAGGFLQLLEAAFDGTRVKANSNRFETWTLEKIDAVLAELTAAFEKQLAESQETDRQEKDLFGDSPDRLPPELATLAGRRDKLQAIRTQLQEAEIARKKDGIDPAKNPAQVPKHDPDSKILPNKEKGYAPNYTPLAMTEGHGGYIIGGDVIAGPNEHQELVSCVAGVEETCGEKPENVLADGVFATGPNIRELESQGVEFFSPVTVPEEKDNPAVRPDPRKPVPEVDWERLPINPQTKMLDKACFRYDAEQDLYYCPRGEPLPYEETKIEKKDGQRIGSRVYRCQACTGCPLAARCVSPKNKSGRTISRDIYAADRERFAAKMQTDQARKTYGRRMHMAETTFGIIKNVMGLRQFLLRGLEKVKIEWLWTCTAFNIGKLVRDLRRVRAQHAAEITAAALN
jgi:transposase